MGVLAIFAVNLYSLPDVLNNENLWRDSENHDTRTLLRETRKQQDTWRYFHHDWPLGNGFYRPIPTLSFIMDDALYYNNLNYYRLTNWFIGLFCSYLLLWMVWEIFRSPPGALGSALIFSAWQSGIAHDYPLQSAGNWLAVVLFAIGVIRGGDRFWRAVVAASLAMFLGRELSCWLEHMDIVQATFSFRSITWPPGRTATLMTLFVLPCVAAYCRWERTRRIRWALLCVLCLALAYLCYEQTIVVPAVLIACAIVLRIEGIKVRWRFHIIPWLITFFYLGLHRIFLQDTRYKKQAFRGATGGWRDVWAWLFPATFEMKFMPGFFMPEIGGLFFLAPDFWYYSFTIVSNAIAYMEIRREWLAAGFGLIVSIGTFLPMAFQHPLAHYYYLPLTFRSIFVAWMAMVLWRSIKSVFAPRERQAPGTPVPTPH